MAIFALDFHFMLLTLALDYHFFFYIVRHLIASIVTFVCVFLFNDYEDKIKRHRSDTAGMLKS